MIGTRIQRTKSGREYTAAQPSPQYMPFWLTWRWTNEREKTHSTTTNLLVGLLWNSRAISEREREMRLVSSKRCVCHSFWHHHHRNLSLLKRPIKTKILWSKLMCGVFVFTFWNYSSLCLSLILCSLSLLSLIVAPEYIYILYAFEFVCSSSSSFVFIFFVMFFVVFLPLFFSSPSIVFNRIVWVLYDLCVLCAESVHHCDSLSSL